MTTTRPHRRLRRRRCSRSPRPRATSTRSKTSCSASPAPSRAPTSCATPSPTSWSRPSAARPSSRTSSAARRRPRPTSLVSFVVGSGRGRDLPAIIAKLVERAAAEKDRAVAEVRSAIPLTDDQQHRLAAALANATGKQVEVKVVVDPSVLGGVVATVGDTVIDGSVRTRLDQIRIACSRENTPWLSSPSPPPTSRRPSRSTSRASSRRSRPAPSAASPQVGDGIARVVGPARVRRQRAARVRGRHRRPGPEPRRGLDRRRRARRGRRHRRGPDREGHRPHPVGARRRRHARPGRERPRRARRRQGPHHRRHHPPRGDPGAVDHGPPAGAASRCRPASRPSTP